MLDSMNLSDKTFAERFVLVLFQVIIHSLVNLAVLYKYTKWSKRGKTPGKIFSLFRSALNLCRVAFLNQRTFS